MHSDVTSIPINNLTNLSHLNPTTRLYYLQACKHYNITCEDLLADKFENCSLPYLMETGKILNHVAISSELDKQFNGHQVKLNVNLVLLYNLPHSYVFKFDRIPYATLLAYNTFLEENGLHFCEGVTPETNYLEENHFNTTDTVTRKHLLLRMNTYHDSQPLNLPYQFLLSQQGIKVEEFLQDKRYINHHSKLCSEKGWQVIYEILGDKFLDFVRLLPKLLKYVALLDGTDTDSLICIMLHAFLTNNLDKLKEIDLTLGTKIRFEKYCLCNKNHTIPYHSIVDRILMYFASSLTVDDLEDFRGFSCALGISHKDSGNLAFKIIAIYIIHKEDVNTLLNTLHKFSPELLNKLLSKCEKGYSLTPYLALNLTPEELVEVTENDSLNYIFETDNICYFHNLLEDYEQKYNL